MLRSQVLQQQSPADFTYIQTFLGPQIRGQLCTSLRLVRCQTNVDSIRPRSDSVHN